MFCAARLQIWVWPLIRLHDSKTWDLVKLDYLCFQDCRSLFLTLSMAIPHRFCAHWSLCCAASTAETPMPHSLSSEDASTRCLFPVRALSICLAEKTSENCLHRQYVCDVLSTYLCRSLLPSYLLLWPHQENAETVCLGQLTCRQKAWLFGTLCSAQLLRTSSLRRPASLLKTSESAHHKGHPQASRGMRRPRYQWCSCVT